MGIFMYFYVKCGSTKPTCPYICIDTEVHNIDAFTASKRTILIFPLKSVSLHFVAHAMVLSLSFLKYWSLKLPQYSSKHSVINSESFSFSKQALMPLAMPWEDAAIQHILSTGPYPQWISILARVLCLVTIHLTLDYIPEVFSGVQV